MNKPLMFFATLAVALYQQIAVAQATTAHSADTAVPTKVAQFGRWIPESGNFEIEIAPCGPALCGKVTQVYANRSMTPGQQAEPVDKRSMLGVQILTGLQPSGDQQLSGEIYNRENGKTYKVRLTMDGPEQMLVRAYVGIPLLGKTQLWRRASANTGSTVVAQ
jgi:uncharacterized protein (DUF2147 family)